MYVLLLHEEGHEDPTELPISAYRSFYFRGKNGQRTREKSIYCDTLATTYT